jgi:hypothetical protein
MLYLVDASVLITAKDNYYPFDVVPEFWEWLEYEAEHGRIKMPIEIFEEIKDGPKSKSNNLDRLYTWISGESVRDALLLKESVNTPLVQRVVKEGYAPDLSDDEVEELGRDPFLIAYGMSKPARCVVTAELPKPSKKRQNRKVPDVCDTFGVAWCGPFDLNKQLGFSTNWKARLSVK